VFLADSTVALRP